MKRLLAIGAVVAVLVAVNAAAWAARLDDSLAALRAKRDPGEHFMFVVVSDMHSAASPERTQALRASMREVALLRPELVVATGDLIEGTGLDWLDREWAENLSDAALSEAPFFPVPGNHDVAGPETEAAWAAANGPLRYSFDHGNSHFVVLNSMERGGVWGEDQLGWLAADLAAAAARHVFVFLHHPLWESAPDRWRLVHEVLRRHPVRMVFAGHWHTYRMFDPVDGIRYVVLPSVGQVFTPETENVARGNFNGYLMVRVDGDDVSYAVLRAGSVFAPEVVLQRDFIEQRAIARDYVQPPLLDFPWDAAVDAAATVVIENPYPHALRSSVTWDAPPGWRIEPEARDYQAPAGGRAAVEFRVRAEAPVRYPTPTLSTDYLYGPDQGKSLTVRRRVELRPAVPVVRAPAAIAIDGRLDEWGAAPALACAYAARISPDDVQNLSARAQFLWDDDRLYLAVTVRDDVLYQPYSDDGTWQADSLQMMFDPAHDGNALAHQGDDYECAMALTNAGSQVWVHRAPDLYEGRAPDIRLAVTRVGDVTTYEAAFPAARFRPAVWGAGARMGYNLAVNDKDGPEAGRRHWWVELLPGMGSGSRPFPLLSLVLK